MMMTIPSGMLMPKAQRGERRRQPSPEQRAHSCHTADRRAPHREGDAALAASERRIDDRQCRRQDHRPADSLRETREDQHPAVRCERREHRGRREDDDADEHHAPSSETIRQTAEHEEQGGEHQRVRLLHPLHLGRGDTQIVHDRRNRHIHDRRIDDDQRHGDADEDQAHPAQANVAFHDY